MQKDCKQPHQGNSEDGRKPPTGNGMWDPPKAGEPQDKTINGKVWKFCAKCKFKGQPGKWTRTHTTAEHKDKPAPAEAGGANLAGASVEQHLFSLGDWSSLMFYWDWCPFDRGPSVLWPLIMLFSNC